MHTVYLSLGSNIGNRRAIMRDALRLLGEKVGEVSKTSTLHETEPWGFNSPNKFLNACVEVKTTLSPHRVLEVTQGIERQLGRINKSSDGIYEDRIIDIDILLYDDITINDPDLKIPHPLMRERDFVMKPLSEICNI